MSDITALAKTLRLAAESEIAHRAESDTSDLWQDEASPENILALVEALEARDKQIAEMQKPASKPVAQIEVVSGVLVRERWMHSSLTDGWHDLFSAPKPESRTVTVKLPTTRFWAGMIECYEKADVITAIREAGGEISND